MYSTLRLPERRLRFVALGALAVAGWILARLFMLQIWQHDYYALFALNTHEIYQKIYPERGAIYFWDSRTKQEYPAAINKIFYLLYAVPREIPAAALSNTVERVSEVLGYTDDEKKKELREKLSKTDDPYEAIAKKATEEQMSKLRELALPGVYYAEQEFRFYPEEQTAAPVLGFVGYDDAGKSVGRYGIEGYWDKEVAGKGGVLAGERGALGSWISLTKRDVIPVEEGADLVLTIDRTLQYTACERLRQGMQEHKAKSAALILLNAKTGAVLAMCSLPDFDPNNYSKAEDFSAYNNTSIFTPYEPGSVFKTITLAAGLDLELVTPSTPYTDPCERTINGYRVRNAEGRCYGKITMTNVLEKSINLGVVWVEEQIGQERFKAYVDKFGFGQKTGITLGSEASGDTSSLAKTGEIFGANASFGQGLTVTPLQLALAYAAIANDGRLVKPQIVQEVRHPSGRVEKILPQVIDRVISERSAKLLAGMLISVVESTYKKAKIPGYYVGGKTGTAQVAEKGSYSEQRTNHTFVGFAPADSNAAEKFVLLIKYEEPARQWAEQTTVPVFQEVMKFTLDYYAVLGKR